MLAQEWLYGPNRIASPYDDDLAKRLALPTVFNPHSSVAVLNRLAERIVFTNDVPTMLYEMHANKQLTYEGVINSARLPYDCFWIEFNSVVGIDPKGEDRATSADSGALVYRTSGGKVRMCVVMGVHYANMDRPITAVTHVTEFQEWPPVLKPMGTTKGFLSHMVWSYASHSIEKATARGVYNLILSSDAFSSIIVELIFGIFLVTQPKVYNDECVTYKPSHRRARVRRGKPPLLEYRRINVHIGKTSKHYKRTGITVGVGETRTDSDEAIKHRKYHKVMGHFRHYDNDKTHRSTWIEAHYRGDPALGVTFIERDVSR